MTACRKPEDISPHSAHCIYGMCGGICDCRFGFVVGRLRVVVSLCTVALVLGLWGLIRRNRICATRYTGLTTTDNGHIWTRIREQSVMDFLNFMCRVNCIASFIWRKWVVYLYSKFTCCAQASQPT